MPSDAIQRIIDADEDAVSFSGFMVKPSDELIPRRLAPPMNTLNYYRDFLHGLELVYSQQSGYVDVNGVKTKTVSQALTDALDAAGVENGLNAQAVVDNGRTQKEINKKTVFEYDTVAAMVADSTIGTDKVVSTNGYYAKADGGGAKYTISSTATDYSIPLANGLHAVFNDVFDIRKFGVRNSKTLDQSAELLRMRNYADTREYVIDFHNFNVMRPKLNAGMSGGAPHNLTNGLWFNKAHHYKNLILHHNKDIRLETGDCLLIFCPDYNPDVETFTIYENITLDPWSPEFQPFTENYSGNYDGHRHGILIHPKGSWGALFDPNQEDAATNHSFKFINVEFLSTAYSYNVTTAGLRARSVEVSNMSGDCIVGLNTDCRYLYTDNLRMNVRYDLVESGRLMVSDVVHFEAEHGGSDKEGITFEYDIYLKNSSATRINKDGIKEDSGQLFWFTPIGTSVINILDIDECSGNVEIQRSKLHTKTVNIHNCRKLIWFTCALTTVDIIYLKNSVVGRLVSNNSGYYPAVYDSKVQLLEVEKCHFKQYLFFGAISTSPQVINLVLDNITIKNELGASAIPFIGSINITNLLLKNSTIKDFSSPFTKYTYDVENLVVDNVVIDNIGNHSLISLKYNDTSKYTATTIRNVSFVGALNFEKINMSGSLDVIGLDAEKIPSISTPIELGGGTVGTGVLTVNMNKVTAPESLNKAYTLTDNIAPNNSIKKTYAANKYSNDVSLIFSADLPSGISVSKYKYTDTFVVVFTNNTASTIGIGGITMTVRQII